MFAALRHAYVAQYIAFSTHFKQFRYKFNKALQPFLKVFTF